MAINYHHLLNPAIFYVLLGIMPWLVAIARRVFKQLATALLVVQIQLMPRILSVRFAPISTICPEVGNACPAVMQ